MKWPDTVVMLSLRQLSGYMQCSYICTVWCLSVCACMCVMDLCVGGWVGVDVFSLLYRCIALLICRHSHLCLFGSIR